MRPSSSAGTRRKRCETLATCRAPPSSGARILVQHKPAGVAVLVTPWNFPAAMATRKIGPALAAGCPVVLKAGVGDAAHHARPDARCSRKPACRPGVVNVIPSRRSGAVVSAMLHDMRVRVVSFNRLDRGRPQAPARGGGQTWSSRRWSSAATRPSSCSRTPTSISRHRGRDDRQDAQHGARPAPPRTGFYVHETVHENLHQEARGEDGRASKWATACRTAVALGAARQCGGAATRSSNWWLTP